MSRVHLASLGAGVAQNRAGAVIPNTPGTLVVHGTSTPVTIYSADVGGSATTSGMFVTDSLGRIPGWVDAGQRIDITIPPGTVVTVEVNEAIRKDQAGGYAGLDSGTKLAAAELPGVVISSEIAVDLCRPPYNCTPGGDITAGLQQAVTDYVVAGSATEFYLGKKGAYTLNGAVQSGNIAQPAFNATLTVGSGATAVSGSNVSLLPIGRVYTIANGTAHITDGTTLTATGVTTGTLSAPSTGAMSGQSVSLRALVPYAGQIVFPAVSWSGNPAYVRLRGLAPSQLYGISPGYGTVITSNAASGNAFSVKVAGTGTYPTHSNLTVKVEDFTLVLPANPQCGGFDFMGCWGWAANRVKVSGGSGITAASLTGTGAAFTNTRDVCGSCPVVRDCAVNYMPIAFQHAEQLQLSGDVFAINCGVVVSGHNSACAYFDRLYAMGCATIFQPDGSLTVEGELAIETTGATSMLFANDPSSFLKGNLRVFLSANSVATPTSLAAIFGSASRSQLNVITTNGAAPGTRNSHPSDRFRRVLVAPAPPAGVPGLTSDTWHPWRIGTGTWNIATAALSLNTGAGTAFCPVKNGVNGGESRTITTQVTTGTTPALTVWAHTPTDGAHGGSAIKASITGGTVSLIVNGVTRGTAPAASVPASSTHTITLALTVQYGLPTRARIAVDGVQGVDYRLTAAESAIFAAGTTVFPYLEDGVGSISDTTSVFKSFVVQPLADDSYLSAGLATLVGGTVDVADTRITTGSVVRLNRQAAGGTLGALSVALTAATKFTINSNNAADTSSVYYEVVSY